jgi:hypothetical protein|tara:strand:- start:1965 stop:2246 length:282 start_codon:yes stop_codon:yes gene_type:complete
MMFNNNYDEDDYKLYGDDSVYEEDFFGDIDEDTVDFETQMEEFEVWVYSLIAQADAELSLAIEEGDLEKADRLKDEIELMLLTDYTSKGMRCD